MTTRIQISLNGFRALDLKNKADASTISNRNRQVEKERIDKSTSKGLEQRRIDATNRGESLQSSTTNSAIASTSERGANTLIYKSRPPLLRRDEPAAPLLRMGRTPKIGHFWWIIDEEEIFNTGYVANNFLLDDYWSGGALWNITGDQYTRRVGSRLVSKLFCGDGSKSVEIVHGRSPQQFFPTDLNSILVWPDYYTLTNDNYNVGSGYHELFAFPAGNGALIIVFVASDVLTAVTVPQNNARSSNIYRDGIYSYAYDLLDFTKQHQINLVRRCFICSNTNIREISIPSAFIPLLDAMHSPETTEVERALRINTGQGINWYVKTTTPEFSIRRVPYFLSWPADPSFFYAAVHDPIYVQYYPDQAQLWQSLIGAGVKTRPTNLKVVIVDTSSGGYQAATWDSKRTRERFNSSDDFLHGRWKVPGEEPYWQPDGNYDTSLYTAEPGATLRLSTSRPVLPEFGADYPGERFWAFWDWDDPAYCRQMCLALGFSPADLTP